MSSISILKRKRCIEDVNSINLSSRVSSSSNGFSTILKESNIPELFGNIGLDIGKDEINNVLKTCDIVSEDEDSIDDEYYDNDILSSMDPYGPILVPERVKLVVQKWGSIIAISPDKFLARLLNTRGYSSEMIPAMQSQYRRKPTDKELKDYDIEILTAFRVSDLGKIKVLKEKGRTLTACNKFGESLFHMACRRSEFDVVKYVLDNIGEKWLVDDFGRTPLHDACWRPEPRFDIVTVLLDSNLSLLRIHDVRGASPLKYVREEHWIQWCAYLFHQKDKYWTVLT